MGNSLSKHLARVGLADCLLATWLNQPIPKLLGLSAREHLQRERWSSNRHSPVEYISISAETLVAGGPGNEAPFGVGPWISHLGK